MLTHGAFEDPEFIKCSQWLDKFRTEYQRVIVNDLWYYLFGAICPARGVGAALARPFADTEAMQMHIDEIALHVAKGAHAVLLLDRAGWHTTGNLRWPKNITPILLPSRSPELNPVEQVWQFLRANYLSNRVFETYEEIIDAACDAWRSLIEIPHAITSIGSRDWANIGQS